MTKPVHVELHSGRTVAAEAVIVPAFADQEPEVDRLGSQAAVAARQLLARRNSRRGSEGASEAASETALDNGKRALVILPLGPRARFDERGLTKLLERISKTSRERGVASVAVLLPEHGLFSGAAAAARISRELALATYAFGWHSKKEKAPPLALFRLAVPRTERAAFRRGIVVGIAVASGVALARDLANSPPNEATPDWMARKARDLARRWKARVTVLGPVEMRRRKMGGILAVGGGSANPPRMIRLEMGTGPRTVSLVGKGVTFDTGGISIKPAAQMDEMKWDKCGACAVLGVFETLSRLRPAVRVRAYLPFAENMLGGKAYRPGDIVRCANGKTVEILNTDAEGRMILADALSWAVAERPDELVEFSTLTGACVVALGPTGAGLFTPSDELASALLAAAERSAERLWRLPLWPEFLDEMRGSHADLKNSGGRWGGASTAAAFLSEFAGGAKRWAHLDIAGPAYVGGDANPKRGATGYGVALTVDWLRQIAGG